MDQRCSTRIGRRRAALRHSRCLAAVFGAALLAASAPASAEPKIELEPRGELMVGTDVFNREVFGGPGLLAAFGYGFDTYPFLVMPELAISGAFYPTELAASARAVLGFRFGLTAFVEPSVYAHAGYALMPSRRELAHAFTVDAGLTLDKRLERSLTLGGSLGYQGFVYERAAHGLAGGLHVGFWL